jgi:molybdopterin-guanine dinucleotide biosynthesis protein A
MTVAVTGVILAGGRGRRMGGADKGLAQLHGRPLVVHCLERLRPQVESVLISANRHLDLYRRFGAPVLRDELPGFCGPLAGILTGLSAAGTEVIVTVPCDCPYFPMDLVQRLVRALEATGEQLAVATDGERAHSLFAAIDRRLAPHLRAYLKAGGRQARGWIGMHSHVLVDFSYAPGCFANLNTAQALEMSEQAGEQAGKELLARGA